MPNLTPEKESNILAALALKFGTVSGIENVTSEDELIDSKQDAIDAICTRDSDNATVVKYAQVKYAGWRDSATDGCDDNPVVFLKYSVRIFQQYTARRSDLTTPYQDIKLLDINLHNKFREKNRALLEKCEWQPLVPVSDIILDVDELTGIFGYSRNYTLEVEVL